jgi:hypothetical protein
LSLSPLAWSAFGKNSNKESRVGHLFAELKRLEPISTNREEK